MKTEMMNEQEFCGMATNLIEWEMTHRLIKYINSLRSENKIPKKQKMQVMFNGWHTAWIDRAIEKICNAEIVDELPDGMPQISGIVDIPTVREVFNRK